MKQRNGAELFGKRDSRSTAIGIIEVEPEDTQQNLLTAILTQEKLGRKHTVILLSETNTLFQRIADFKDLQKATAPLETQLVFVSIRPVVIKFARQNHYPHFASLENYAQYAQTFLQADPETTIKPLEVPSLPAHPSSEPSYLEPAAYSSVPPLSSSTIASTSTSSPDSTIEEAATQPLQKSVSTDSSFVPTNLEIPANQQQHLQSQRVQESVQTRQKAKIQKNTTEPVPIVLGDPLEEEATPVSVGPDTLPGLQSQTRSDLPDQQNGTVSPYPQISSASETKDIIPSSPTPHTPISIHHNPVLSLPDQKPTFLQKWLKPLVFLGLVLLIIGGSLGAAISGIIPVGRIAPALAPATIIITPKSQLLEKTYQLSAITTYVPTTDHDHIQARFISSNITDIKSVPTTGKGTITASVASGNITITNTQLSSVSLPKGAVFTNESGQKIAIDENVVIQEEKITDKIVPGTATISAHMLQAGSMGNISAHSFKGFYCCPSIYAENETDFTGGRDADPQPYSYVEQRDIDTAVTQSSALLQDKSQTALRGQVGRDEKLIDNPACSTTVEATPKAGERGSSVTIETTMFCTGEVYDQQNARNNAEERLKNVASQSPGAAYSIQGNLTTQIRTGTSKDSIGTLPLQIQTRGLWVYQFSNQERYKLIQEVAGKSKKDAERILAQYSGIKLARIDLSLLAGQTLPVDPHAITLTIQPGS